MNSSRSTSAHPTDSDGSAQSAWLLLFLTFLALTASASLQTAWSGNEINYFDLAYRMVQPEEFSAQHAAVDGSNARINSSLATTK